MCRSAAQTQEERPQWYLLARVCCVTMRWVAYDDLGVPVGDLGVVIELCCANGLFAGLLMMLAMSFAPTRDSMHCWRFAEVAQ